MTNPVGRPAYKVTFLGEPLPPVQKKEDETVINFSLTIPEVVCLGFFEEVIKFAVHRKTDLMYLGAGEEMQRTFSESVKKSWKNVQFSPEELNLDTLVTSIWTKSRFFSMSELELSKKLEEIVDEKAWQNKSAILSLATNLDKCPGMFFTGRQIRLFARSLEDIAKSAESSRGL